MYLLNSGPTFHRSFLDYFFLSLPDCFVHYFSGPVPASIADITFDLDDYHAIFENSVLSQIAQKVDSETDGVSETASYSRFSTRYHIDNVRRHYHDTFFDLWRLHPTRVVHLGYSDESNTRLNQASHADTEAQLRTLHFAYYYSNVYLMDTTHWHRNGSNWGQSRVWNRYAYQAPILFEYEQEVSARGMMFWGHSSSNYCPGYYSLDIWDSTLNAGAGGWTRVITDNKLYDALGVRRLCNFGQAYTSTKFKITFSDTGKYDFYINTLHLYGEEPSWGKDPVDITWALVGGWNNAHSGYFDRYVTDSYSSVGRFPFVMVDVGDADSDACLKLDKTTGLVGTDTPQIQNFVLDFKDN